MTSNDVVPKRDDQKKSKEIEHYGQTKSFVYPRLWHQDNRHPGTTNEPYQTDYPVNLMLSLFAHRDYLLEGGPLTKSSPHPDRKGMRASSRVFFIPENAPDLRKSATYTGHHTIRLEIFAENLPDVGSPNRFEKQKSPEQNTVL